MILIKVKGEVVVEVIKLTSPYTPKENEYVIETLPKVTLGSDEIGRLYYRNGQIEVVKEKR